MPDGHDARPHTDRPLPHTDEQDLDDRRLLLVVFLITVTGITVNTLVTPSISEILDGLGAPASLAGVLIGAATLPGIALAPVIGLLADRFGRREVLVPCLLIFAVAGGLAGLAGSIWWLAAARVAQGVGSAGLINLAVVVIGDHWQGTRRAQIIGWNAAVLTTSLALLPTIGGALTELGGWRAPFAVYPLALGTAVAVWRTLARGQKREDRFSDQVRAVGPLLRRPAILVTVVAALVCFALIFGLLLTALPLLLAREFGLSPAARGMVLGVPAVANAGVSLSLGWLRTRTGRARLLVLGSGLLAAGLAAVALSSPLTGVLVGLAIFGLGEGLLIPNLQDIATDAGPDAQRGTSVALFVSGARTGQTIGPVLGGAAFAAVGPAPTFLAGAAVASLLAVGLHLTLRRNDV